MSTHRVLSTRKCADCPAMVPAHGGRKRCPTCQDKERIRQVKARDQKRRASAKEAAV